MKRGLLFLLLIIMSKTMIKADDINIYSDTNYIVGNEFRLIIIITDENGELVVDYNNRPGKLIIKTTGTENFDITSIEKKEFVNGVAMIPLKYYKAEKINIILIDVLFGMVGTSKEISFLPLTTSRINLYTEKNKYNAGDTIDFNIKLYDKFDNIISKKNILNDSYYLLTSDTKYLLDNFKVLNDKLIFQKQINKKNIYKLNVLEKTNQIKSNSIELEILPSKVNNVFIKNKSDVITAGETFSLSISVTDRFNNIISDSFIAGIDIIKDTELIFSEKINLELPDFFRKQMKTEGKYIIKCKIDDIEETTVLKVESSLLNKIDCVLLENSDSWIIPIKFNFRDEFNNLISNIKKNIVLTLNDKKYSFSYDSNKSDVFYILPEDYKINKIKVENDTIPEGIVLNQVITTLDELKSEIKIYFDFNKEVLYFMNIKDGFNLNILSEDYKIQKIRRMNGIDSKIIFKNIFIKNDKNNILIKINDDLKISNYKIVKNKNILELTLNYEDLKLRNNLSKNRIINFFNDEKKSKQFLDIYTLNLDKKTIKNIENEKLKKKVKYLKKNINKNLGGLNVSKN